MTKDSKVLSLVIVLSLAAIVFKSYLAIFVPGIGGDTIAYKNVALNIINNFCISLSDPKSGECVPHWGGNHLPGYPSFLAVNYLLFGQNDTFPKATTIIFVQGSILILSYKMKQYNFSIATILITFAILSFSPLHLAQSRFLLTEYLIIGLNIFLMAQLLDLIYGDKFPIAGLFSTLAILLLVRYDSVILIVPIFSIILMKYKFITAIYKIFILSSLIVVFSMSIALRHAYSGLSIIPAPRMIHDGSKNPDGYLSWAQSWIFTTEHQESILFPISHFKYHLINIPDDSNLKEACRNQSISLLRELKTYDQQPFPNYLDAEFYKLTSEGICTSGLLGSLRLLAKRTVNMWFTFTSSFGWPVKEAGLKDKISNHVELLFSGQFNSLNFLLNILLDNFWAIVIRAIANLYWFIILLSVMGSSLIINRKGFFEDKDLLLIRFIYILILSKIIFSAFIVNLSFEIRLLTALFPYLEFLLFACIMPKVIKNCRFTKRRLF